jgi:hypothetical protein
VRRPALHNAVLKEILQERVVSSRNRRNRRGVKRKMSSFPLRRKTDPALPPLNINSAIRIVTPAAATIASPAAAHRKVIRPTPTRQPAGHTCRPP